MVAANTVLKYSSNYRDSCYYAVASGRRAAARGTRTMTRTTQNQLREYLADQVERFQDDLNVARYYSRPQAAIKGQLARAKAELTAFNKQWPA